MALNLHSAAATALLAQEQNMNKYHYRLATDIDHEKKRQIKTKLARGWTRLHVCYQSLIRAAVGADNAMLGQRLAMRPLSTSPIAPYASGSVSAVFANPDTLIAVLLHIILADIDNITNIDNSNTKNTTNANVYTALAFIQAIPALQTYTLANVFAMVCAYTGLVIPNTTMLARQHPVSMYCIQAMLAAPDADRVPPTYPPSAMFEIISRIEQYLL